MTTLPHQSVNRPELVSCKGASGQTYWFELDPIGAHYKPRPGAYVFLRRAANGNYDPLYIGETESFQDRLTNRLTNHHQWISIAAYGGTHIATMFVAGGLAVRERIETDIRHAVRTPCNQQ